ncbi:MAG: hypothetical protein F6J93_15315 [Oscillatoria sp. SIO1A7]|nr:hypothetical protein [Oscillatoria sp. SIO1A7]
MGCGVWGVGCGDKSPVGRASRLSAPFSRRTGKGFFKEINLKIRDRPS